MLSYSILLWNHNFSLPDSKKPVTGLYPEPDESNSYHFNLFFLNYVVEIFSSRCHMFSDVTVYVKVDIFNAWHVLGTK
jgi:hypothetical protein